MVFNGNFYELLREKYDSSDSNVLIPDHEALNSIYQVYGIYNKRPIWNQSCTHELFNELFRQVDLIVPSWKNAEIMLVPLWHPPRFLLAVVLPNSHHIYFLDTLHDTDRKKVFFGNVPNNFGHLPEQYQVNRLDVYMGS